LKRRAVVFSPEAKNDLLRLYDWIADASGPAVALSYVERLESYCLGFDLASDRGYSRHDLRPGLRLVGFERRVTIAFAVDTKRVAILRLLYGGRDWKRH
jgi:toxin ParE1/3/4